MERRRSILPDTRHLQGRSGFDFNPWARVTPEWEELTVNAISPDGRVITLNETLQFNHFGAATRTTCCGCCRTSAISLATS
jgi:hypothetical protein